MDESARGRQEHMAGGAQQSKGWRPQSKGPAGDKAGGSNASRGQPPSFENAGTHGSGPSSSFVGRNTRSARPSSAPATTRRRQPMNGHVADVMATTTLALINTESSLRAMNTAPPGSFDCQGFADEYHSKMKALRIKMKDDVAKWRGDKKY